MNEDKPSFGRRRSDIAEETQLAVMATDISYIKKDMLEVKDILKTFPGVYLTQKEHAEFVTAVNTRFASLETQSNLWRWLSPTLSASVASIITFLVIEYFTKLR